MEDWILAAYGGVDVEKALGVGGPEGLVKLHKDRGVGSRGELLHIDLYPSGEAAGIHVCVVSQSFHRMPRKKVRIVLTALIPAIQVISRDNVGTGVPGSSADTFCSYTILSLDHWFRGLEDWG